MSWICVFCETENCDNTCICEVCCKSKGDFYEPLIENHITCKEIAIKGRKCELKKKFQDIGFTKTSYFNADLVGKFAGFNQVFLYMIMIVNMIVLHLLISEFTKIKFLNL